MTNPVNGELQKAYQAFILRMRQTYSPYWDPQHPKLWLSETDVRRLLKEAGYTGYSVEIEEELETAVKMKIYEHREKLRERFKTILEPCWLEFCKGTIIREQRRLPKCSEGGVRHYLAFDLAKRLNIDPGQALFTLDRLAEEKEAKRILEVKHTYEVMYGKAGQEAQSPLQQTRG